MNTQTEVSQERAKRNYLKHTIKTPSMDIDISLDDDCHNGHNDFSMTGTIWEPGKKHTDRNMISGGCIHDEILKRRPNLKIFADLHLCTHDGVPMYAEANGFYWLREKGKEMMQEYMRTTPEQSEILSKAEDQEHFLYLIHSLKLPAQWKAEADKAIEILQDWTNTIFVDDSKRQTLTPLSDELKQKIETRLAEGYYSDENKEARRIAKQAAAKQKAIDAVNNHYEQSVRKENNERLAKLAVLLCGLPIDNFIYYSHTNEGCFNWHTSSYTKEVSPEQFQQFLNDVKAQELPEGITFKLKG